MSIRSPFPDVDIPKCNVLMHLFPSGKKVSEEPIWIDAKDSSISLSPAQLLKWAKRLAVGLGKAGLKRSDVVLIYTPNHIFVPAAYLGSVGGRYVFSGANPVYTPNGNLPNLQRSRTLLTSVSNRTGPSNQKYRSFDTPRTSCLNQECH